MSGRATTTYKTKSWSEYDQALRTRGSLTIWFDPEMCWTPPPSGKRGRQPSYSDAAIQTCLTMKVLFGMALRQATGFVESLLCLMGLDWTVPDYSRVGRTHCKTSPSIWMTVYSSRASVIFCGYSPCHLPLDARQRGPGKAWLGVAIIYRARLSDVR
jgi:hypothetical protein